MEIPINADYKIDSDAHCWRVCKRKVSAKGEETWNPKTYHGSAGKALKAVGESMLRESKAIGVAEALKEIERVSNTLSQALSGKLSIEVVG